MKFGTCTVQTVITGIVLSYSSASTFDLIGAPCFAAANYGGKIMYEGCKAGDRECLCHNKVFLETLALCVDKYSDRNKNREKVAFKKIINRCKSFTNTGDLNVETFENFKKSAKIEKKNFNNSVGIINHVHQRPFDVDPIHIIENIQTKSELLQNHELAETFGFSLMVFMAAVIFLKALGNLSYKISMELLDVFDGPICRKIRKKILMPALVHRSHSEPQKFENMSLISFVIPTRVQSVLLFLYLIGLVILMFIPYKIYTPNFMYEHKKSELMRMVSDRAGIAAISQLPMIILFGGRNNFLTWLSGWPIDVFNVYHRWISRMAILMLIIHGVCYSTIYILNGSYSRVWNKSYWIFGNTALISGGVMLALSIRTLRQKRYEVFLVIHIILAGLFIGAAWRHLHEVGEMEYIYASVAVWGVDRIIRVIRILVSGAPCEAQIRMHHDDTFKAVIQYSKRWRIYPGSYIFIYFLNSAGFWQSHPFSIVEPLDNSRGNLEIYAKAQTGLTRNLYEKLTVQRDLTLCTKVLVEGPYGSQNSLHKYYNVTMIAGGIGITGIYNYSMGLRKNPQREHEINLIWIISSEVPLVWFGEQLEYIASCERFRVTVYVTGYTEKPISYNRAGDRYYRIIQGRPDLKDCIIRCIENSSGPLAVLVCGPGSLNDQVRKTVAENLELSNYRVDYFEEAFSW